MKEVSDTSVICYVLGTMVFLLKDSDGPTDRHIKGFQSWSPLSGETRIIIINRHTGTRKDTKSTRL